MHLSSSLCCMWFVRADDESVYEWRELISPEWSLSLPLSLLLSPLLSLQYLSIQSKRIPLCPCYPLQHCSFLQGASACLMSQFNIIQLRAEGVTDLWATPVRMRGKKKIILRNILYNPAFSKCLIMLRSCYITAFPHIPLGCRLHANTNNKRQPQSNRHKFNKKKNPKVPESSHV